MKKGCIWGIVCFGLLSAAMDTAQAGEAPAPPKRTTLTDEWFGLGPTLAEGGLTLRIEWSQFYQGLVDGDGDHGWEYGGKWDALLRLDLSKLGFWEGLSVTAQGSYNHGNSVNSFGGTLLPVNSALAYPGLDGDEAHELMSLYLTQNFNNRVILNVGKINLLELARGSALKGGGGVDTFWSTGSAPTGLAPPVIFGAMAMIRTEPVSFSLWVFDPTSALNHDVFDDPFEEGVNFQVTADLTTTLAGRTGTYGIKGLYSTREGFDLRDVEQIFLPPESQDFSSKKGSYFVGVQFKQYLVQDPANPNVGWGLFGEAGIADANPNPFRWTAFFGIGGNSFIPGRENDRFGLAYFHFGLSDDLKDGLSSAVDLDDESGIELFYNCALTPWFRVTADFQYIDPGFGDSSDAIFAGIGTSIRF